MVRLQLLNGCYINERNIRRKTPVQQNIRLRNKLTSNVWNTADVQMSTGNISRAEPAGLGTNEGLWGCNHVVQFAWGDCWQDLMWILIIHVNCWIRLGLCFSWLQTSDWTSLLLLLIRHTDNHHLSPGIHNVCRCQSWNKCKSAQSASNILSSATHIKNAKNSEKNIADFAKSHQQGFAKSVRKSVRILSNAQKVKWNPQYIKLIKH